MSDEYPSFELNGFKITCRPWMEGLPLTGTLFHHEKLSKKKKQLQNKKRRHDETKINELVFLLQKKLPDKKIINVTHYTQIQMYNFVAEFPEDVITLIGYDCGFSEAFLFENARRCCGNNNNDRIIISQKHGTITVEINVSVSSMCKTLLRAFIGMKDGNSECPICFEEGKRGKCYGVCRECGKKVCSECISIMPNKNVCPMCRGIF